MKSPLLIFLGISVATHTALLAWHGVATDLLSRGQQIQVSLLSGERQVTVNASRHGNDGNSGNKTAEKETANPAAVAQPNSNKHDSGSRDKDSASVASLPQRAVTPSSGEKISREIHRLLAARFTYPPLALRQGYQGLVLVTVSIEPNGKITGVTLARSSGYRILDLAAVESVLAIHRAPQLQQWLRGRSISINVPVNYRLIEA